MGGKKLNVAGYIRLDILNVFCVIRGIKELKTGMQGQILVHLVGREAIITVQQMFSKYIADPRGNTEIQVHSLTGELLRSQDPV